MPSSVDDDAEGLQVETLFASLDMNDDGTITFGDFMNFFQDATAKDVLEQLRRPSAAPLGIDMFAREIYDHVHVR